MEKNTIFFTNLRYRTSGAKGLRRLLPHKVSKIRIAGTVSGGGGVDGGVGRPKAVIVPRGVGGGGGAGVGSDYGAVFVGDDAHAGCNLNNI